MGNCGRTNVVKSFVDIGEVSWQVIMSMYSKWINQDRTARARTRNQIESTERVTTDLSRDLSRNGKYWFLFYPLLLVILLALLYWFISRQHQGGIDEVNSMVKQHGAHPVEVHLPALRPDDQVLNDLTSMIDSQNLLLERLLVTEGGPTTELEQKIWELLDNIHATQKVLEKLYVLDNSRAGTDNTASIASVGKKCLGLEACELYRISGFGECRTDMAIPSEDMDGVVKALSEIAIQRKDTKTLVVTIGGSFDTKPATKCPELYSAHNSTEVKTQPINHDLGIGRAVFLHRELQAAIARSIHTGAIHYLGNVNYRISSAYPKQSCSSLSDESCNALRRYANITLQIDPQIN